ncbi:hypothetical protein [Paraburkholderia sp.]|jgi:hypothetical protein|uniref:hypothetical protein n=1 Tax=Paraburkholderia sp. TaxID=1926495 RepID=UPI002F3F135C
MRKDGQLSPPATIYVAPPDRHMPMRDGVIVLSNGPKETRRSGRVQLSLTEAAASPVYPNCARKKTVCKVPSTWPDSSHPIRDH